MKFFNKLIRYFSNLTFSEFFFVLILRNTYKYGIILVGFFYYITFFSLSNKFLCLKLEFLKLVCGFSVANNMSDCFLENCGTEIEY